MNKMFEEENFENTVSMEMRIIQLKHQRNVAILFAGILVFLQIISVFIILFTRHLT